MTAHSVRLASDQIQEKGDGVRFDLPQLGPHTTGFAIRFDGQVYAYVNRCAHVPVELDWEHGKFFNVSQQWIICATHGAMYAPDSGQCVMGPCKHKALTPLNAREADGWVEITLPHPTE